MGRCRPSQLQSGTHSGRDCFLCRWFCCTCWCSRAREEEMNEQRRSQGQGRQLPEEVYRQIKVVDNQTSTLTQAGVAGFSARVLDAQEAVHPASGEVYVVQLVEIIKKPGQSLGLYLREGNGLERPNGVFASRFGDNSELERYGDVIRPGDEILSINNVDVASMSIDDVVLTLSIPRRLILRIRFNKKRRDRVSRSNAHPDDRPVVVFHKVEERTGEDSSAPLVANPTSTANTWLGRRARQQQQEMQQQSLSRMSHPPSNPSSARSLPSATGQGLSGTLGRDYGREGMVDSPRGRVSPAQRPILNGKPEGTMRLGDMSSRYSDTESDTVARTARVPPPKIYSSTVRRAESFSSQPGMSTSNTQNVGYSIPRSSTAYPPPDPLLSRSLCSPILPRPLRHNLSDQHSNSLPRRRAISGPRNVKWRNDVVGKEVFDMGGDESDGTRSADEYAGRVGQQAFRLSNGGTGRTINDIFSAAEYRYWAGDPRMPPLGAAYSPLTTAGYASPTPPLITGTSLGRQSRWSHTYGDNTMLRGPRSSSLTGRTIMTHSLVGSPLVDRRNPIIDRPSAVLDRYHVSPLMNRRAPLRTAGPGINVDRLNVNSLSGMLFVQIYEGRGLRIPEKHRAVTEEMYCVLEVDEAHRARTGVSTPENKYRWRETFHIDIFNATQLQFFVYSWHPQHRHSLCHKGQLKLLEAFVVDQLNGEKMLALNLEPRGQLCVRVGFHDMQQVFRRTVNPRMDGVFGVPLPRLLQRERRETPLVLCRLIAEIEKRGVDNGGLYILCGAVEKKRMTRDDLETNAAEADISVDGVPDTNVLACLIKDFLRELPDPLIPPHIHNMILDAASMSNPNDVEANRQMVFRIIDCLSLANKNTLLLVMDHLSAVLSSFIPPAGVPRSMIVQIFAPLILCTADSTLGGVKDPLVRPLDVSQAASSLQLLFDVWPSRVNGSEVSSDGTSSSSLQPWRTSRTSESQC